MSYYREQLEEFLSNLEIETDKVIDIGGGSNPVKDRVKKWKVNDYVILDNELEKMKVKPDIVLDMNDDITLYKAKNILNHTPYYEKIYDGFDIAFCLEVAEYWYNPLQALNNINKLLKKNGTLYISFPFIYPHHNPKNKDYLRYTRWGVEKLLEESGFALRLLSARLEKIKEPRIFSWFMKEGMHPTKDYMSHMEIGYIIKCIKL